LCDPRSKGWLLLSLFAAFKIQKLVYKDDVFLGQLGEFRQLAADGCPE
jgi:hypothetical protein